MIARTGLRAVARYIGGSREGDDLPDEAEAHLPCTEVAE
jgi:hypothetical protein